MERLLAVLKLEQSKNYTEITYKNFKDAIKSTWNEKSKNASDSLLFSQNKIDMAYTHVIKELKSPIFDEEDVIIHLIPYLNGSMETRGFSLKHKCKQQVKELVEREIIDLYTQSGEESKNLQPNNSMIK
jgi:hypothetical protein